MIKIIIPTQGYIECKKVDGPVLSPYMETKKEIIKMLARGVEVLEVLPGGEYRKLSIDNMDTYEVREHRNVKPVPPVVEAKTVTEPKVQPQQPKEKHTSKTKKEKKKQKQKQNKQIDLGFEIDILESK